VRRLVNLVVTNLRWPYIIFVVDDVANVLRVIVVVVVFAVVSQPVELPTKLYAVSVLMRTYVHKSANLYFVQCDKFCTSLCNGHVDTYNEVFFDSRDICIIYIVIYIYILNCVYNSFPWEHILTYLTFCGT